MSQIKLVVFNEHTLGYIFPEQPQIVHHLHASVLKGATFSLSKESDMIFSTDKVRLANETDFDEYRVVFNGYKNNPEYLHA